MKRVLVTGTPRSGTLWASKLFAAAGYDVAHERMGKHGCSSFMLTPFQGYNLHDGSSRMDLGRYVWIHQVRPYEDWRASWRFDDPLSVWVPLYMGGFVHPRGQWPTTQGGRVNYDESWMKSLYGGWNDLGKIADFVVRSGHWGEAWPQIREALGEGWEGLPEAFDGLCGWAPRNQQAEDRAA